MNKPALDKPHIILVCNPYEHQSSINTRVTLEVMEKDLSRDDILGVLEKFMRAIGYNLDIDEQLVIDRVQ